MKADFVLVYSHSIKFVKSDFKNKQSKVTGYKINTKINCISILCEFKTFRTDQWKCHDQNVTTAHIIYNDSTFTCCIERGLLHSGKPSRKFLWDHYPER